MDLKAKLLNGFSFLLFMSSSFADNSCVSLSCLIVPKSMKIHLFIHQGCFYWAWVRVEISFVVIVLVIICTSHVHPLMNYRHISLRFRVEADFYSSFSSPYIITYTKSEGSLMLTNKNTLRGKIKKFPKWWKSGKTENFQEKENSQWNEIKMVGWWGEIFFFFFFILNIFPSILSFSTHFS